jgi:hypothetical protein
MRAIVSVGVAGVVASMVSFLVFSNVRAVVSTLAGVGVAIGNLWSIAYVIRGLVVPSRFRLPFALVASAKMVVLLGGIYLLLWKGWVDPLPLALGLAALPFGIIFGFIRMAQVQEEG